VKQNVPLRLKLYHF